MNMEIRFWVWIVGSLESSAPWKQDKTQDKNRNSSTHAVVDSNLYIYLQALCWKPKPHASSGACCRGGTHKSGRQGRPRKFLPRRNRILLQAASSGAWLHRRRVLAPFLWGRVLYRAWAAHGLYFLRRGRIFCASDFFQELASFLGGGEWQAKKKKKPGAVGFGGLVAFQETWLHRTCFPGFFSVVRDSL